MAIEKSLSQAPLGIDDLELDGQEPKPPLEIDIVNPEMVHLDDGSVEITIVPGEKENEGVPFDANLVEYIDDKDINNIVSDLIEAYDNDLASRKDWEKTYVDGLKLLGLKYEERMEPWPGACGVFHPMIAEAAVRFQAEAIMETFPAKGPVKTSIIGKVTPEKTQAALRVEDDMNYQLTELMPEYRPEHERMLWNLPITGSAFKKVYYDPALGRQVSMFVPAEDVILPYGTSELTLCPRVTHRMRKSREDIIKLQEAGFYTDVDIPDVGYQMQSDQIQEAKDKETGFSATYDDRPLLLEIQVDFDIPGFEDTDKDGEPTGIASPYIITIIKDTQTCLAIRRNWEPDDRANSIYKQRRQHFVHYQYVPGFGAYGFGLLHLIGNSAKSATSITRQLVDAGTVANLPGGLKTRGLRIKGDDTPIAPGEFRDVDVSSGVLKDNIMPLPYKEPSQTLLTLRGIIAEEAQKFAAAPDMKIADMSANAPVGTTLALIERNLKVMSAVQARMHFTMKQELQLLAKIIRDYADEDYKYDPEKADRRARKNDYSHVEIIPVSDPNASTLAQRVVQYQAVIQLAQQAPQIYNLPKLHRQMLDVLNIKDADKLVPLEEDEKPTDPVTENMNILNGKPVKAFIDQDHEAHIAVHMAAMQDPKLMQLMGQNPQAQVLLAAGQAHVTEHIAFAYRQQVEQQLGVALPNPEAKLPPEAEAEMSKTIAQAASRLLQKNQAEIQMQKNIQAQQDPIVQMQQQELHIKQQEVAIKQQLAQLEAQVAQAKIQLDQARLESENQREGVRVGAKVAEVKAKLAADHEQVGLHAGIDIAKTKAQIEHEKDRHITERLTQTKPENKPQPKNKAEK
jgi:hypothetical protein